MAVENLTSSDTSRLEPQVIAPPWGGEKVIVEFGPNHLMHLTRDQAWSLKQKLERLLVESVGEGE